MNTTKIIRGHGNHQIKTSVEWESGADNIDNDILTFVTAFAIVIQTICKSPELLLVQRQFVVLSTSRQPSDEIVFETSVHINRLYLRLCYIREFKIES
jgi:hypothetical protein